MRDLDTIKRTVERASMEGLNITEHALRMWIKRGVIPVRKAGNTSLVYFPNLRKFLTCADGDQDNVPIRLDTFNRTRNI